MSDLFPPAGPQSAGNAHSLATRIVAAVVMAFLSLLALSAPVSAQTPPTAPNPAFPVGSISVTLPYTGVSVKPIITWSTHLPANANAGDHVFFIRQKLIPSGIEWVMQAESEGEALAAVPIYPGCSTFELWAVNEVTARDYLLDTTTMAYYLPTATVAIRTEDPYAVLPRTRADRPFYVDVTVNGILSEPYTAEISKSVNLTRHVQSYGATGTGDLLDRTQATLLTQASITSNGALSVPFALNEIPGANRAKVRGEERFSIFSPPGFITDPNGQLYHVPASQIDSQFVQIWPVADASISGIAQGQILGTDVPQVSFHLNDLYPSSTTWAQVYQGSPQLGITGTVLPGSSVTISDSVPANRTINVNDYGAVFHSDGVWTMELLTQTPFGIDRITHVSFMVRRSGMTLAEWRQSHFGSASNSGDGADDNDFDKDGLANLIEFAFGFDPKQPSAGLLPAAEHSGDNLSIRFTPPAGISGIRYGAEWSGTLQPGSWIAVANTGALPEHVFSVPVAGKPRLYLRLTATEP